MADTSNHFDVIVIGGGVMGSSTAYQLAKRGSKTLLLEQFDFLHHLGSSHGESRTMRATYAKECYTKMALESSKLWEEAEDEIGYKVYFKTPQLNLGPSDDKSVLSLITTCKNNSYPYEVMGPEEVGSRFSGRIGIPENWVAVLTEHGGVIRATKAVSMFQSLAFRSGAILRDNMEVTDVARDGGEKGGVWVFTASGEKFWAKKCVVTVGAWMSKLVKKVSGLELPIQPIEVTVCYWKVKDGHEGEFGIEGRFPTFSGYGDMHVYGTPSLEFPGLIKILIHGGYPCDPDKRQWQPGMMDLSQLKEWIKQRFRGLIDDENGPVTTQLCMYSMTPDEDFVIDFLGGEFGKDVVIGGGFSGHGFKMAPAIGNILADLALGGEAKGVELKHFRIRRFEDFRQLSADYLSNGPNT